MRYSLVSEGSNDRMLQGPIEWLLSLHCGVPFSGEWVNPSVLDDNSRVLSVRLGQTKEFYPCDIAFVHRDVDASTVEERLAEILGAAEESEFPAPVVCVIPVRMTEAWFLFDEPAIRRAADRPSGTSRLNLPTPAEAQRRADPKSILGNALVAASGLSGRRLDQFKAEMGARKLLVSNLINDYSPLRRHASFADFEGSLVEVLNSNEWGI